MIVAEPPREKRQPWMKWYPSDWRADPRLHMCSLAARGLWIEMLGYMHEAEPYGYFLVNGRTPQPKEIANLVGSDAKTVARCLQELRDNGVFSTDETGCFSRRMLRDKAKAAQDRENGKGGGNPNLRAPDNHDLLDGVNPPDKAQMPEARDQRPGSGFTNPRAQRASAKELGFDDWYAAYPKHEDRGHAEQAFVKARKIASLEELIAGAQRYVATVDRRENGRFIALPATWLNGQRWRDETAGAANGSLSERRKPQSAPPIDDESRRIAEGIH